MLLPHSRRKMVKNQHKSKKRCDAYHPNQRQVTWVNLWPLRNSTDWTRVWVQHETPHSYGCICSKEWATPALQVFWNILHTVPVTHLESAGQQCLHRVISYAHFRFMVTSECCRAEGGPKQLKMAIPVLLIFQLCDLGMAFFFCPECLYGLWFLVIPHLSRQKSLCWS